jgi:septal ring factor EnvC (AmiA/AmiB activator)
MATKRDNKIRAISGAIRQIDKSISELKHAMRLTETKCAEFNTHFSSIRDAIFVLRENNNTNEQQIDNCVRNVARLYAKTNSSANHDRHSGTRTSPSGVLAETGAVGLALPGSFESHKK